jgi:hypothetical protein
LEKERFGEYGDDTHGNDDYFNGGSGGFYGLRA